MEKILAAHNALTAYKPKYWLGYLALPFSKCQSKKVEDLYSSGVRLFDFRIRVKDGKIMACHGMSVFKVDLIDVFNTLQRQNSKDTIYIRIVNEDTWGKSSASEFLKVCTWFRASYPEFKYQIIPSKKFMDKVAYSEFPSYSNNEMFWYKWRIPLFPWFYAKENRFSDIISMRASLDDGIWWFDFI